MNANVYCYAYKECDSIDTIVRVGNFSVYINHWKDGKVDVVGHVKGSEAVIIKGSFEIEPHNTSKSIETITHRLGMFGFYIENTGDTSPVTLEDLEDGSAVMQWAEANAEVNKHDFYWFKRSLLEAISDKYIQMYIYQQRYAA